MLLDAFMFYNELDILELRLEVLDRHVDRFVLVEAEVNHVGGPKELFFQNNKERYAKWLHKIEHVIMTAEEAPKDPNPWSREKYQRECIMRGLTDTVPDTAVVMVSDVDEIPNLEVIPYENLQHIFTSVHMWMFEYSLDYLFTGEPWFGTVITTAELLRRVGPNKLRDSRWKFPCVQYAGWHLSSFGTPMHVWNKMQTFAHAKDGHHAAQTPEMFKQWIEEGVHTDGKTSLVKRPDVVPLPAPAEVLRRLKLGTFP
jgi:beta-1,4-mannosyl-glycoprotein beta-1,4-N-acetylglucosaminyltransferase